MNEFFRKITHSIYDRRWVHKGELASHLTYLSATFFGSHGIASAAAGVLAIIIIIGLVVAHVAE